MEKEKRKFRNAIAPGDAVVFIVRYWLGESIGKLADEHNISRYWAKLLVIGVHKPHAYEAAIVYWRKYRQGDPWVYRNRVLDGQLCKRNS